MDLQYTLPHMYILGYDYERYRRQIYRMNLDKDLDIFD